MSLHRFASVLFVLLLTAGATTAQAQEVEVDEEGQPTLIITVDEITNAPAGAFDEYHEVTGIVVLDDIGEAPIIQLDDVEITDGAVTGASGEEGEEPPEEGWASCLDLSFASFLTCLWERS
ncbi:MAG: hypothetical protein AAF533_14825 [Acidobacteriota bacterium]